MIAELKGVLSCFHAIDHTLEPFSSLTSFLIFSISLNFHTKHTIPFDSPE